MSRKAKGLAAEWRAGDRWVGRELRRGERELVEGQRCQRYEGLARRAIWDGVDPDIALEAYDIATERLGREWRSRSRALVEGATTIYREKAQKARERLRRIERDTVDRLQQGGRAPELERDRGGIER